MCGEVYQYLRRFRCFFDRSPTKNVVRQKFWSSICVTSKGNHVFNYGYFSFDSKESLMQKAAEYWNPGKVSFWTEAGTPMVIDRREGYFLYDMSGKRLIDLHLNGGTYNFGHRHPELVEVLKSGLDYFDMGNHWFPSVARAAFAEQLVKTAPHTKYAIFGAGGAEAVEIALKTARYATKRKKIVSIIKGYHGHSGLAVATGDERFSKIFLSDKPDEFVQVPFNDAEALENVLKGGDVAAFIIETIPATYGFPMPDEGYLKSCQDLCHKYGAKFISDEVQTGLMRTGVMWGWQGYDLKPDIFVCGKGLGGGIYPISACLVTEECGQLADRGWRRAYLDLRRGRAGLPCGPSRDGDAAEARGDFERAFRVGVFRQEHARDDGAALGHLCRGAPARRGAGAGV